MINTKLEAIKITGCPVLMFSYFLTGEAKICNKIEMECILL